MILSYCSENEVQLTDGTERLQDVKRHKHEYIHG